MQKLQEGRMKNRHTYSFLLTFLSKLKTFIFSEKTKPGKGSGSFVLFVAELLCWVRLWGLEC
jgi:hypothetical protein